MDKIIKQGLLFSAGFDKKSEKEMRETVNNIISSASNINFDTPENRKELQSLISVFRDMFESVGNKKIDFAKMLNMPGPEMFDAFKQSANEIANVWADVVSRMGTNSLRNVFMKDERSLNDAFERLKKNGVVVEGRLKNLGRAFKEIRATDINKLLNEAIGEEMKFATAETWEERTAAALRYIKIRDKILSVKSSENFDITDVDREQVDFFKNITSSEHKLGAYLIRDLKEVAPEMQTSLNNIFNLYQGKEIEIVPRIVDTLNIGDIFGQKGKNVIEVPVEFKAKLDLMRTLFKEGDFDQLEKMQDEIASMFPEELQDEVLERLGKFIDPESLKKVTDRSYQAIWKDFVGYGMSVGDGVGGFGTGTGIGDGTGVGDASSAEVEGLRQQVEEAEERTEMYRRAMDSMQEEMAGLRGQLADRGVGDELNIDLDDDEDIKRENGALEDKLELLRDIAEQYGSNITQKQRDRHEELNQKDMDVGLTSKEDERYWELSEQIEEADNALEEFSQTYDKVILKLANGKKVEILPDDKGLRSLYKFNDEYGETYGGVEIEDVEFVRKAIQQETNAISEQNEELKENANLKNQSGGTGTGQTGGATTEEVVDLEKVRAKVAEITTAVEAKTNAFKTEGTEVGNVVDGEIAKLGELENKVAAVKTTLEGLLNNIKSGTDDVGAGLSNITVNVDHQKDEEDKGVSIDKESLKQALGEVIYNVKITHDDNDKQANKIAIDEGTLENVLKRVFVKELAPQTEQPKSEIKNETSAVEKILPDIQEALGQIQANTAKIEPQQSIDNVERTLSAIKTAIESVDKKIVRGTKTVVGGEDVDIKKKPKAVEGRDAQILAERIETQKLALKKFKTELITSGKMTDDVAKKIRGLAISLGMVKDSKGLTRWGEKFKQQKLRAGIDVVENKDTVAADKQAEAEKVKLAKQYQELGVLQARADIKQTEEAKVRLAQLQQEIAIKQESLKLSEEEFETLKQISEEAKEDELGVLGAKKSDKDEKKRLANEKKMYQKQAMVGKAGSAVGRAENTLIGAFSLSSEGKDAIPAEFKQQVDEYHTKLEQLRQTQAKLQKMDGPISDEDQKDLITQINNVNKLTDELGELVSQYQRLSGKNSTVIGQDTLRSDASLSQYRQQLEQAVMAATNGKAQIKGFDNETKKLTYTVKTGKNEFTEYTAEVRGLDRQLVATAGSIKKTETFLEATKRKMKELTSYFSGMAVFNQISQELRRGIQYVREIDDALVELRKVTDETDESYDKFLRTAAKTGSVIGATISEVTEATATFSKLGYDMEMATEMAESAIVYKNVGDNIASAEDAADSIISTLKGFRLESSETMRIVDRFNEVGKSIAHVI